MLEEIRQRSLTKANSSTKQVVLGVYRRMIAAHNEFCDCNYCDALREYVKMKKWLCSNRRRMFNPEYDYFYDDRSVQKDRDNILKIKYEIKKLKLKKDSLKAI